MAPSPTTATKGKVGLRPTSQPDLQRANEVCRGGGSVCPAVAISHGHLVQDVRWTTVTPVCSDPRSYFVNNCLIKVFKFPFVLWCWRGLLPGWRYQRFKGWAGGLLSARDVPTAKGIPRPWGTLTARYGEALGTQRPCPLERAPAFASSQRWPDQGRECECAPSDLSELRQSWQGQ